MKFLLDPFINVIETKPFFGVALVGQGLLSSLLVWLKMLTPVIGFLSAVLGLAAAGIAVMIKWREWKQGKK